MSAFGVGPGKIGMVLIVNLDRQPKRLRRTLRELGRFTTSDGASLARLTHRLPAVDARDGRAVAATADVDPSYRLADQLYVQPDARLEACFCVEEPVKMTRQEVAVARSHVEAWKVIVSSSCDYVLVLEDDVWFRNCAAAAIDLGWHAACRRAGSGGPNLLYLSYDDAGGTASRVEVCDALFRPERGLWFLSGYVLSRQGAEMLLRAMPVVGPVDMWMNYRFEELGALALASPAILQRPDGGSDNSYSVLPFLARAGIVDADTVPEPPRADVGPVLAWTTGRDREGLAMALSMLGLRVRVFDGDEHAITASDLSALLNTFDALVDAPLAPCAVSAATLKVRAKFVFEAESKGCPGGAIQPRLSPPSRTALISREAPGGASWQALCALLGLDPPIHAFPEGAPRAWRLFRDDRPVVRSASGDARCVGPMDDTPWTLLPRSDRPSPPRADQTVRTIGTRLVHATMTTPSPQILGLVETFPGNLAAFAREGLRYGEDGASLVLDRTPIGDRPYRSGALASAGPYHHGRFEAEIRAARGSGLVTGFFLHRQAPRQEIDVELTGDEPHSMLVNVYFNPGDDGAAVGFGYRGSPCRIDLGFDAASDFHLYAIDWRPGCITWSVDGRIVHERVGWDPTPIPHLPMRLHANLWAPRSEELAGQLDELALPSFAMFRNISIWT
jgi:GR25 family glycosyltransferase involved in LPS biosynthesis